MLVYGAEQFKGSVEYADNATKEECTIIDYAQKACSYKCAGDNRAGKNCNGHTLTYYGQSLHLPWLVVRQLFEKTTQKEYKSYIALTSNS